MDKLTAYQKIVEAILRQYYQLSLDVPAGAPTIEDQILIDHENGHYQLMHVGWDGMKRVYGSPLHLDIKDGKIWIQADGIDIQGGIAKELTERGVPKEDIVLAFHAPYKRPYTGFAVA
ncbi:MAG: XisI protein [Acidobacteria bacterium]|nr:XisI protein [Acidobacteriota bacterium]MBI3427259.1 XisI protein [Acidobacteriota bacterium]